MAIKQNRPDLLKLLLDAGASPEGGNIQETALTLAIRQNQPDLVKLLLDAGAVPEGGDCEETGLTLAIQQNNLLIVQMLLEAGADPNHSKTEYRYPMMCAARQGKLEVIQLLVAHGADVNLNSDGETAFGYAIYYGYQEIYDYLYPHVDSATRRYADGRGQKDLEKALIRIARNADPHAAELASAAFSGEIDKIRQLLAQGANPNSITENGDSPLLLAATCGNISVMEVL
jgi:ankyrin repeat protein